jgi:hypothetical protein
VFVRETRKEIKGLNLKPRALAQFGALNFKIMKESIDVYYGDCQHVFSDDIRSDDCIHRFFNLNIPTHDFYGRVIVCNEYFRLKVRESIAKDAYKTINDIIKGMILDALKIENILYRDDQLGRSYYIGLRSNDLLSEVNYTICQRPYITLSVSLELAVNKLSDDTSFLDFELRSSTYNRLNYIATKMMKLAKYKKHHNQIYQIMNKIMPYKHHYEYDDETHSLYNPLYKDFMVLLFEILTKKQVRCNQ